MDVSKPKFTTVDEYIGLFPPEVRTRLETLRRAIKKGAPKAEEVIAYGMAGFKQNGYILHFAGYKNHIGLYPRLAAFKKELEKYPGSKGTVKFSLDEPIPVKLVSEMAKHQVIQNGKKSTTKTKSK